MLTNLEIWATDLNVKQSALVDAGFKPEEAIYLVGQYLVTCMLMAGQRNG